VPRESMPFKRFALNETAANPGTTEHRSGKLKPIEIHLIA
jgi:hypothetical protein